MDLRQRVEKKVDAKIKFEENLYKYLVVNSIIAIICLVFLKNFTLLMAVMLFWGIDVLSDFLKAYSFEDIVGYDYRERKVEEELSRLGD
ncbi:MAG: 2TM domain-containing protein [Methanobrevibacter sp.]|uniref:2TM domain-containing protein n=1 Tax=Methanobrevibacter sp. TaxID=66852 RepID=UPI0025D82CEA|nr:2TM domain-containing protein [Methanobrevibacter sp.]MBR0270559.1 2TM domain-containing protein [Methanobrevibacter sp.]